MNLFKRKKKKLSNEVNDTLSFVPNDDGQTLCTAPTQPLFKDIKFKGFLSYRGLKILGFLLLVLAQACIAVLIYKLTIVSDKYEPSFFMNFLYNLSSASLPALLLATFAVILRRDVDVKKVLFAYIVFAALLYLLFFILFEYYFVGILSALYNLPYAEIHQKASDLFHTFFSILVNYNIFTDLALCTAFYFFTIYEIKSKVKWKKKLFRAGILIPISLIVTSFILFGLNDIGILQIPILLMFIMPCRTPSMYFVFFFLAIFIKYRQSFVIKKKGEEYYKVYKGSNRDSFHFSLFCAALIGIISAIDFGISFIPGIQLWGFGLSYQMAYCIPFVLIFSYIKSYKTNTLDLIIPLACVGIILFVYVELVFQIGISTLSSMS